MATGKGRSLSMLCNWFRKYLKSFFDPPFWKFLDDLDNPRLVDIMLHIVCLTLASLKGLCHEKLFIPFFITRTYPVEKFAGKNFSGTLLKSFFVKMIDWKEIIWCYNKKYSCGDFINIPECNAKNQHLAKKNVQKTHRISTINRGSADLKPVQQWNSVD